MGSRVAPSAKIYAGTFPIEPLISWSILYVVPTKLLVVLI